MGLDVRVPIGGMFSAVGLLLTVFGIFTRQDSDIYDKSLQININLWWGLAMLAFGIFFLVLGLRRKERNAIPATMTNPE